MSNLTENSMYHSLYLSKQYLTPCQSQQLSKMRHILSHSWLNYNWRTKAATDDLHHHWKTQVKRDDHTFSSKTVWKQRCTLQKQNLGICHKLSRYVPYKCTYVLYDGTFGASDQGQMLDVWGWHPADVNAELVMTPDVTTSPCRYLEHHKISP
jgi:hypothetical protein